jgi:hypothetical protein
MSRRGEEHWCWRDYPDEAEMRLFHAYQEFFERHRDEPTLEEWRTLVRQVESSFEEASV